MAATRSAASSPSSSRCCSWCRRSSTSPSSPARSRAAWRRSTRGVALIDAQHARARRQLRSGPQRRPRRAARRDAALPRRPAHQRSTASTSSSRAGETVALVGPSGAGKTTLVNLLPRFIEPSAGSVLLDGQPLPEWSVTALRRQFAMVSQDVVLFNDTRRRQRLARRAAPTARTASGPRRAARAPTCSSSPQSLPQGSTPSSATTRSEFSGGQRQRLAIARAIYKDAPILILDEATSALDSESERLVQQALGRLMNGRTSLVIAHRLSTIERADRIVVVDAGRIVAAGQPRRAARRRRPLRAICTRCNSGADA